MDPRVVEHARILTEFDEGGLALAEATAGAVARRGGQPLLMARSGEASRAFLAEVPDGVLAAEPKHLRALVGPRTSCSSSRRAPTHARSPASLQRVSRPAPRRSRGFVLPPRLP